MEAALPGIFTHLLSLHIVDRVELPDDIQHTKNENRIYEFYICKHCETKDDYELEFNFTIEKKKK